MHSKALAACSFTSWKCSVSSLLLKLFFLCSDRLSAQDLLSIKKVQEYVCPKLFGNKDGKVDNLEEKAQQVEILCMDQVSGWAGGVRLFFYYGDKEKL